MSGCVSATPARCTTSNAPRSAALDVRNVLPSARSVIVCGTVYNVDRPYSNEEREPGRAAIARYAWGDDYHVVIETRLRGLEEWLRGRAGDGFEARSYVDTGPVQERVYAQYAGHRMDRARTPVSSTKSSGRGCSCRVIITNLELAPDAPALDQCGTCARCLDACPTGALVEPHVLDSTQMPFVPDDRDQGRDS